MCPRATIGTVSPPVLPSKHAWCGLTAMGGMELIVAVAAIGAAAPRSLYLGSWACGVAGGATSALEAWSVITAVLVLMLGSSTSNEARGVISVDDMGCVVPNRPSEKLKKVCRLAVTHVLLPIAAVLLLVRGCRRALLLRW